jgi:5-(carboxyamino)imidazole ribonucleotide synthase
MKLVCMLGNSQLGRMLRQAGELLGISADPISIDATLESVPYHNSVITDEIEQWSETALIRELAIHNGFVNRDIFLRLADRLAQKQLINQLNLPTAPWRLLANTAEWPQVFSTLGELADRQAPRWRLRWSWSVASALRPTECFAN